ncbi:DUF1707 SHOCT-like domain-containing protein [Pseudonocardia humida]|uniref:DUF1707 and DUF2154 domain-containing protein n=1 Tax=Pseudonocardia humida TaxID=2800819 RepID=A0ABT1A4G1_9PSEU|nr:DUF1707 domain-containing protein [Pseudonocardia humida]MCO1657895.1 DUF1707 and DUF2154 domain-containing protein [Pseudonocardia humida]
MTVQPPDPAQPPGIRISDADRERAAERLHQALAEGRITVQELEERLSAVYAAKYEADLVPPLIDLPGGQIAVRPAAAVPAANTEPVVLRSGMSTIKRTGAWSVPPKLRVQNGMGSVVLDFVEADNPHPVVEIELELGAGSAKLIVPDEATANVDGVMAAMGSVRSKLPSAPRPGVPHFIVTGRASMGSVTVRKRFRWGG